MAGTRLLVHVSFLLPFLVWIAVTCGLSFWWVKQEKDPQEYARRRNNNARWIQRGIETLKLLDTTTVTSEDIPFVSSPTTTVTLIVADSQVVFWKNIVQQPALPGLAFSVQRDTYGRLESFCSTRQYENIYTLSSATAKEEKEHVIWVCEDYLNQKEEAQWMVVQGTIVFCPSHMKKRAVEWKAMIQQQYEQFSLLNGNEENPETTRTFVTNCTALDTESSPERRRRDWKLAVAVEVDALAAVQQRGQQQHHSRTSSWKDWMDAVNEWILVSSSRHNNSDTVVPQHVDIRLLWNQEEHVQPQRRRRKSHDVNKSSSSDNDNDTFAVTESVVDYYTLSRGNLLRTWDFVTQGQLVGTSGRRSEEDMWHTTLYVPSFPHLLTLENDGDEHQQPRQEEKSAILTAAIDNLEAGIDNYGWISMIANPVRQSLNELTAQALHEMSEYYDTKVATLFQACRLEFATDSDGDRTSNAVVHVRSDGSVPRFLNEQRQRQILSSEASRQLVQKALHYGQQQLLLQQEKGDQTETDVALSWWRTVESIQLTIDSRARMTQGFVDEDGDDHQRRYATTAVAHYLHARRQLDTLVKKMASATDVEADEAIVSALVLDDFPMDQKLAILSPLLLPLLLPLLFGLVREVKRYRALVQKRL